MILIKSHWLALFSNFEVFSLIFIRGIFAHFLLEIRIKKDYSWRVQVQLKAWHFTTLLLSECSRSGERRVSRSSWSYSTRKVRLAENAGPHFWEYHRGICKWWEHVFLVCVGVLLYWRCQRLQQTSVFINASQNHARKTESYLVGKDIGDPMVLKGLHRLLFQYLGVCFSESA